MSTIAVADITPGPLGSAGSAVSATSGAGLLGFWAKAVPTGVILAQIKAADGIGAEITLPPITAPSPIEFPPVSGAALPGQPTSAPAMPAACPNNFFGDPPTRAQQTTGHKISAAEIAKRRKLCEFAIGKAKAGGRPLSAENFQFWLDGKGGPKVMNASDFQTAESRVPDFLKNTARKKFEEGFKARLKQANHPQGTLQPSPIAVGALGPVRFLQFRDGIPGGATFQNFVAGNKITDLDTAVGSFFVHSALWAQAKVTAVTPSRIPFVDPTIGYEVTILRWCVQIYDVYDWNQKAGTPFVLTQSEFDEFKKNVPQDIDGVSTIQTAVIVQDTVFADMEVSGTGKSYLIRTDAFEAPANVRGVFTIAI